jgi:hypothetical protein
MDDQVKAALLQALDGLNEAVTSFAKAQRWAVMTEGEYRDAEREREETENFHRSEIITLGLSGTNETQRNADLRVKLDTNRFVRETRDRAARRQAERETAAANLRIWDVRQKAARAEVAALTALLGREG